MKVGGLVRLRWNPIPMEVVSAEKSWRVGADGTPEKGPHDPGGHVLLSYDACGDGSKTYISAWPGDVEPWQPDEVSGHGCFTRQERAVNQQAYNKAKRDAIARATWQLGLGPLPNNRFWVEDGKVVRILLTVGELRGLGALP